MHNLALSIPLSFFFFQANRPRSMPALPSLFLPSKKILAKIDPYHIWLESRGRGGARGQTLPEPSPISLLFDHRRQRQPPMGDHCLYRPPCSTPPRKEVAQPPHACPGHRCNRHWRPARTTRHRPPPVLSPRDQPRIEPLDQFPKPVLPEIDHAMHPDRARPMLPCRPECTARATRSRAPTPRLAPLFTHTCMAPCSKHDATLALPYVALTRSRRTPFSPQWY
jgi:hypothetical protein